MSKDLILYEITIVLVTLIFKIYDSIEFSIIDVVCSFLGVFEVISKL